MGNPFDEMRAAISEARIILRAADDSAQAMANILCGRLRHCSPHTLAALKRELHGFNANTKRWTK